MKKKFLSLVVATALTTSLSAAFLDSKEAKAFEDIKLFKESGIKVKNVYEIDDIYIVNVLNGESTETIYVTKNKKYLIAGNVINMEQKEKLFAPIQNIKIAKNKESFSYGKGDKEVYVFTDPECPYCKELEKYLPQLEDKYKFKIYHLPILKIHPNAKELSKYQIYLSKTNKNTMEVLSKTTESEDYINRKYDAKTEEMLDKKVDEQMKIAKELGITGTPTLVTPEGNVINWVKMLSDNGIELKR